MQGHSQLVQSSLDIQGYQFQDPQHSNAEA